ncbi:MAG: TetR/AcrR family transcriptional regulator [Mobilitalea sp.]
MSSKSDRKRELILKCAETVFIKKGFSGVTMKDIIEECGISRGGIYLYYSSVDDVFIDVIKVHNQNKLENIKRDIDDKTNFEVLLDQYFILQKQRLLHMEESLLLAMFEFYISHKQEVDTEFLSKAFESLGNVITEILNCGVRSGYVNVNDVQVLAEHMQYCIKGLEVLAMSSGIEEKQLERQFSYMKKIILKQEGK